MKTFVMIPTYNEKENICRLIERIKELQIPDLHIAVVDDSSPDGTADAVKDMMNKYGGIHLLVRKTNKGRGHAGRAGFKYCVAEGADYVIEMDADFSHDPSTIPRLLEKINQYDLVIGSRFVKGARNVRGGAIRNFITWFARAYIQTLLGVKVSDPTSGYRCFKREVLQAVDLDSMIAGGPAILQELLHRTHICGFSIVEIPILFEDRTKGKSSFNYRIAVHGFLLIPLFRLLFSKPRPPESIEVYKSTMPIN